MNIICILLFTITAVMLFIEPQTTGALAREGLLNWFNNMIPSLFPFMILQSFFIGLGYDTYVNKLLHPFFKKLFHLNPSGYSVLLIGFLCGFPMGAITVRELYQSKRIRKRDAELLLAFCNNLGPIYCISHILPLLEPVYKIIFLVLTYGVPLLYGSFITRLSPVSETGPPPKAAFKTLSEIFPSALQNAINSIVSLGGCMIFFNVIRIVPALLPFHSGYYNCITSGLLEIGSFITCLKENSIFFSQFERLCLLSIIHPGGLSCLIQTMCVLQETDLSFRKYVFHKLLQLIIWLLICTILSFCGIH